LREALFQLSFLSALARPRNCVLAKLTGVTRALTCVLRQTSPCQFAGAM
jgi:hypothetical protein